MKKVTVETFCPIFDGLYESTTSMIIDDIVEDLIDSYNEEHGTDYSYDDFVWEYDNLFKNIAIFFVKENDRFINVNIMDVELQFEELIRPKYYDYSTDSINVKMTFDKDVFLKIIDENYQVLADSIKDKYTSRSGVYSSYSNDIDDWIDDIKKDIESCGYMVGSIFNILMESGEYGDIYDEIIDLLYEVILTNLNYELDKGKNTNESIITSIKEWKEYVTKNEDYELTPSNRKSFYGKAKVIDKGNKLILKSYDTQILEYDKKTKEFKFIADMLDSRINTHTTRRHINAFFDEQGLPNMTKKDIEKYYEANESKINEAKRMNRLNVIEKFKELTNTNFSKQERIVGNNFYFIYEDDDEENEPLFQIEFISATTIYPYTIRIVPLTKKAEKLNYFDDFCEFIKSLNLGRDIFIDNQDETKMV